MMLQKYFVLLLSVTLAIILSDLTTYHALALTVDNQLVSARNDCFERVALEAMMPFDKTFRTEDTNSLKNCKEKCLQAGERCQSMSFGVHRRGNGTCQLSSEKYSLTGGRPKGVIFDPDFDLYTRKTNCFDLNDNAIPLPDGTSNIGATTSIGGGYGGGLTPTPTVLLSNRPDAGTPVLMVDPMPSTVSTTNGRPPTLPAIPTNGYGGTTTAQLLPLTPGTTLGPHTTDGDRLYFSHELYPLYKYPTLYEHNYPAPNDDFYIPGGYATNVPSIDVDRYRPNNHDDNVHPTPQGLPRPIFGLGYGNGYSYGKPERYNPTTLRPYNQGDRDRDQDRDRDRDRDRPSYAPRPEQYPNVPRPERPMDVNRPNYDTTPSTYYTPPTPQSSRPNDYLPDRTPTRTPPGTRPNDRNDFTNRPDPPPTAVGYGGGSSMRPPLRDSNQRPTSGYGSSPDTNRYDYVGGTSMRPPIRDSGSGPSYGYSEAPQRNRFDYVRRNDTAPVRPGDGGYNYDKTISTYFNPEDYMYGGSKYRPRPYAELDRLGYPMDEMKSEYPRKWNIN